MDSQRQEWFAREVFSAALYEKYVRELEHAVGMPIPFRVAEMPVFVAPAFRRAVEQAAQAIVEQCTSAHMMWHTDAMIPPAARVAQESPRPLCAVVDFAVALDDAGEYVPKLIELQGFPSLFGYQWYLGRAAREVYGLGDHYTHVFSGVDEAGYPDLLRASLVAGHDPDEVALLEFDPERQKTRCDFSAIERLTGIRETDIRLVRREGDKLFHLRDGVWRRIRRIFNRAIVDELNDNGVELPFRWTDDLDVEWAGHPNWFFRISKGVLPYLSHQSVPTTIFASDERAEHLGDYSDFVLKPLYAFAGKGVVLSPTRADLEAIPEEQRHLWVLQQKVEYAPCVYTPEGMNKVELRVMLLWPDSSAQPLPVMSLVRTGRGPMMNINYNSIPWTGSSGCLFC